MQNLLIIIVRKEALIVHQLNQENNSTTQHKILQTKMAEAFNLARRLSARNEPDLLRKFTWDDDDW